MRLFPAGATRRTLRGHGRRADRAGRGLPTAVSGDRGAPPGGGVRRRLGLPRSTDDVHQPERAGDARVPARALPRAGGALARHGPPRRRRRDEARARCQCSAAGIPYELHYRFLHPDGHEVGCGIARPLPRPRDRGRPMDGRPRGHHRARRGRAGERASRRSSTRPCWRTSRRSSTRRTPTTTAAPGTSTARSRTCSATRWRSGSISPTCGPRCCTPTIASVELAAHDLASSTGDPWQREYRLIGAEGQVVWVRDQAVLLRDVDGNPTRWQGVMVDITAEKEAQLALAAAHDELEFRVRARTAALAGDERADGHRDRRAPARRGGAPTRRAAARPHPRQRSRRRLPVADARVRRRHVLPVHHARRSPRCSATRPAEWDEGGLARAAAPARPRSSDGGGAAEHRRRACRSRSSTGTWTRRPCRVGGGPRRAAEQERPGRAAAVRGRDDERHRAARGGGEGGRGRGAVSGHSSSAVRRSTTATCCSPGIRRTSRSSTSAHSSATCSASPPTFGSTIRWPGSTMIHPDDREEMLAASRDTWQTGEPWVSEYRILAADGRVVWLADRGHCVERDEQGRPIALPRSHRRHHRASRAA